nr:hypothetical protein [Tanacetum cinerariifolium]
QFALLDRLSMIEHLFEQLAELYSKHDLVKVVSLAGKTIQVDEMFELLVDHRHLSQTPDVGFPPSDRSPVWSSGGSFLIIILSSSLQNGRIFIVTITYEVLDEWDDRVRTSASSVAFTDSSIREIRHSLVEVNLGAGLSVFELPLGLPSSFADPCTDVQCRRSQTHHQQTDWFAYTQRRMFPKTLIFPQSEMLS